MYLNGELPDFEQILNPEYPEHLRMKRVIPGNIIHDQVLNYKNAVAAY